MHKVIALIVQADDKKEAWDKMFALRDLLCDDDNHHYDYGTFFNEDSPGASRWGKLTPISKLDSKKGDALLQDALNKTKRQFMDSLKDIKKTIEEYTDEEIYDGKVTDPKSQIIEALKDDNRDKAFRLYMFRYHIAQMLSQKDYAWLYLLSESEDIKDKKWISTFENKINFDSNFQDEDKSKYWIAPMDVHY